MWHFKLAKAPMLDNVVVSHLLDYGTCQRVKVTIKFIVHEDSSSYLIITLYGPNWRENFS